MGELCGGTFLWNFFGKAKKKGEPWQPPGGTWGTRGNQLSTRAAARGNLGNLGGTLGEPRGNLGGTSRKAWGNHAAEQPSSRPGEPGEPWGNLGGTSGEPWGNLGQPFPKDFLRKAWGNLGGTLSRLRAAEQPSSRAGEPRVNLGQPRAAARGNLGGTLGKFS